MCRFASKGTASDILDSSPQCLGDLPQVSRKQLPLLAETDLQPIMTLPPAVSTALGTLAVLATASILALTAVLGHSLRHENTTIRVLGIISSVLEGLVLVFLGWLVVSSCVSRTSSRWTTFNSIWFGASLLSCVVASAVSVAALVQLSKASDDLPSHILGSTTTGFLIGTSVALGLSFALQLVFLVTQYFSNHTVGSIKGSQNDDTESRRSPQQHVKAIPYHETMPMYSKRGSGTPSMSPPGSSAGRSATETMSSIRTSLSQVVRPITSKSRLLPRSQRSSVRPSSIDSAGWQHDRESVVQDGFDTWDTSSVDSRTRQTVFANSSSPVPGRFLETIPASPTVSRSPSPGSPLDLLPPVTRTRSRSFSPAPSVRSEHSQARTLSRPPSATALAAEAHIHPLFRSDSPIPPPIATPGTVVTAAPLAGQVIPDRKTLNRMRSGSLPAVPSPLSRQGSCETFQQQRRENGSVSPSATSDLPEEPEEEDETTSDTERKMTPPIPEWVLSAGSRLSLHDYNNRKSKGAEGAETQQQI